MKAYMIVPAAKKITEFDFDGKHSTLADILHVRSQRDLIGVSLDDEDSTKTAADVLFMLKDSNLDNKAGVFMISALPMPIGGNAVVIGVDTEIATDALCMGSSRDPGRSLAWLTENVVWLERLNDNPNGPTFKIEEKHNPRATAENVLRGLAELQRKGYCDAKVLTMEGEQPPRYH